jgi:hypothetical protein
VGTSSPAWLNSSAETLQICGFLAPVFHFELGLADHIFMPGNGAIAALSTQRPTIIITRVFGPDEQ